MFDRTKMTFFAILSLALASISNPAVSGDCGTLLKLGYTNISNTVSKVDSLTMASGHICNNTWDFSSSTDQTEVGIAIDDLDFSFSSASKTLEQKRNEYCQWWDNHDEYHSDVSENTKTIYQGALDAWTQCLALDSQGVKSNISVTPDLTAVTVSIWNSVGNSTQFNGLHQPQQGKASCKLAKGDGSATTQATENTKFIIGPSASTFSCTRIKDKDPNSKQAFYPQTRLTFSLASTNQINVDLPSLKLSTVSTSELKNLMTKVSQLQTKVTSLEASKGAPDYDSGWFYVSENSNYDKTHNLNALPRNAVIWAADAQKQNMYMMDSIYTDNGNGGGYGAWLQRITNTSYRISTGMVSAMSAYGVDSHWNWDNGRGYIRVMMWK